MTERSLVQYQEVLENQYALPWEERRKLVSYEGSMVLNEYGVNQATSAARTYQLPLNAIALIQSRNGVTVYVKAEGVLFRLHHDPRGVPDIDNEVIDWGDKSGAARAKCTVRIGGHTYVDFAQLTLEEEKKRNPRADNDTLIMKCITKATRRACMRAVGLPLPSYEESKDYVEADFKEVQQSTVDTQVPVVQNASADAPKNLAELMARALREYQMGRAAICERLGVKSLYEITDFAVAWETLRR